MFVKELHHITRDARSLALALAMPVMMLLLFGYALSLDVDRIPTLVYDQDGTSASRDLVRQFQGSRYFDIRGFASDYAHIERGIDRNQILIGVVIPRDFGSDLEAGRRRRGADSCWTAAIPTPRRSPWATRKAWCRPTPATACACANRARRRPPPPPVDARLRVWYNSSLESKNYVVPGLIAVILHDSSPALLTSLTIAREWEMGTMEQLLSTPLRPAEMVLGKMLAYFVVGLADSAIALIVGVFVFGVPFRGSILLLAISTCLFLFGVLFWGIFISAAAPDAGGGLPDGHPDLVSAGFLLSGFVFAIDTMPKVIQVISVHRAGALFRRRF